MTTNPGWFPEPSNRGQSRYWDGQQWTDHVLPTATIGAPSAWAVPTDGPSLPLWSWLLMGAAGLLLLVLLPPVFGVLALVVLVTAILALTRNTATWMRLPSRRLAIAATAIAAACFLVAGGMTAAAFAGMTGDAVVKAASSGGSGAPAALPAFTGEIGTAADTSVTDEQTALAVLATLPIKGRASKTDYDRDAFGQRWLDVDRNGCDTRNDILARDLTEIGRSGPCTVMEGMLADPFTGESIEFERGEHTSAEVQIDHVVALSDAWQKGAAQLTADELATFANDPLNLLAVSGPANTQKGDGDAATWLPRNKAFRCSYVARQVSVKATYGLWVTQAEHDAIAAILAACPDEPALTSDYAAKATAREEVVTEPVVFGKTSVDDPTLLAGQTRVTTPGQDGERTLTYRVKVVDGKETGRELISDEVTTPPVAEVTAVGTAAAAAPPAPAPAPAPAEPGSGCDPNYAEACVPASSDVDCAGGSGNGPAYFDGVARVVGSDIYGLDRDGDGYACEPWGY
ncbi:G5 domain-containing protein [Microbacterium sp. CFBP9034]|uniref:G5 domain-containing protein n=1 Tax=Microbacterium sp. CFBP9034 TaxID=3096540 RepID=UPI002A6AC7BF|nr:G5 domain-containing protein [Microbacterium sp. CFBP9034]MDY0910895.1 G5 domain-containing protein [Microbacterium sp. CFBP9034]